MVQNERLLRDVTATAASVVTVLGAALLMVAMLTNSTAGGQVMRDSCSWPTDSCRPAARRTAVAVLTVLSAVTTFIGPQTASAERVGPSWLTGPTPTTQPTPEPTPIAIHAVLNDRPGSAADPARPSTSTPPAIAPPGIGVPAAPRAAPVVHDPDRGPRMPAARRRLEQRSPRRATRRSTQPPPPVPGPASAMYKVVPGDCLWSIASRALGGGATSVPSTAASARHLRSEPLGYRRRPQPNPRGPRALPPVVDHDALTESHPPAHSQGSAVTVLTLVPWTDPIIDTLGHDPRSNT